MAGECKQKINPEKQGLITPFSVTLISRHSDQVLHSFPSALCKDLSDVHTHIAIVTYSVTVYYSDVHVHTPYGDQA